MGTLILQDGSVIKGNSVGAIGGYEGELVFTTSMSGYQETLTDPSYAKQIVIMSYPEIGNYGINDQDFESDEVQMVGMIAKSFCKQESHYLSKMSIMDFFKKNNVIALDGIDTRSLIKKIREIGCMNAFITSNDVDSDYIQEKIRQIQNFKMPETLLDEVSVKNRYVYNPNGTHKIAFLDYGVKKSILANLAKRNCKITVYPASATAEEILKEEYEAIFLSNGPGNPADYKFQIGEIRKLMGKLPIFGICLGYQLLALAAGAKTYKLKYGHRGINQTVMNLNTNKILITSQNHGYAVQKEDMPKFMKPTYINLNDNSLEGFEIPSLKICATQFHPEANPGPNDALVIFDEWVDIIKANKNQQLSFKKAGTSSEMLMV